MLNGSINYTDLKLMKRCKQKCDTTKREFSPHWSLQRNPSKLVCSFVRAWACPATCPGDEIHFAFLHLKRAFDFLSLLLNAAHKMDKNLNGKSINQQLFLLHGAAEYELKECLEVPTENETYLHFFRAILFAQRLAEILIALISLSVPDNHRRRKRCQRH